MPGPNTHVCPVCLGMPGVLPVINREAVDHTIRTGLALNCEIPEYAKFDRKNYAYPDLMKWYQISQYDLPLCINGHFDVEVERCNHPRRHNPRSTWKKTPPASPTSPPPPAPPASLIDVNRSGAPLMEIVSEPDIQTPAEAMAYGEKLRALLRWTGVSTANMEDGALRIDRQHLRLARGRADRRREGRSQEHELVSVARPRPGLRNRTPDRAVASAVKQSSRKPAAGTNPPASPAPSEPRNTPTTTATSPNPTCRPFTSPATASTPSAPPPPPQCPMRRRAI